MRSIQFHVDRNLAACLRLARDYGQRQLVARGPRAIRDAQQRRCMIFDDCGRCLRVRRHGDAAEDDVRRQRGEERVSHGLDDADAAGGRMVPVKSGHREFAI